MEDMISEREVRVSEGRGIQACVTCVYIYVCCDTAMRFVQYVHAHTSPDSASPP